MSLLFGPDGKLLNGAPPKLITGITPETVKRAMRAEHYADTRALNYRGFDRYKAATEFARTFWARYEQINRDFLPDDPVYSVIRSGMTAVAATDMLTFLAVASRQWRLLEIIAGSEGTASAAARIVWQTSTAGTTSGGALTPEKFNTNSPASLFSTTNIVTTWSVQPTLSTNPKLSWGFNALGGFIDWKAAPGEEDYRLNEQVSERHVVGVEVLSITTVWEEL